MNKYAVPVYDDNTGDVWIETIVARGLNEAKDKLISDFVSKYDLDFPDDWDDFVYHKANYVGVHIGEVEDIEEL